MSDSNTHDELNTQIQYRLIEKLSESERCYRELIENLNEIVFKFDHQGCLTFLNPAWTRTLGYSVNASLGQPLADFIDPQQQAAWQVLLTDLDQRSPLKQELKFRHICGQVVWLEVAIQPRKMGSEFSGSLMDVTDRHQAEQLLQRMNAELEKRVEQCTRDLDTTNQKLRATIDNLQQIQCQLMQSEKMSGLVNLVAGVAHEINNPVNFIYGNLDYLEDYLQTLLEIVDCDQAHDPSSATAVELLMEDVDLDFLKEDSQKIINSIRTGTSQIRQIVVDLRNFSQIDESELKMINIHEDIDGILKILNYQLKAKIKSISIEKNYGELPLIECYPRYLNQALMSILENAIDATDAWRRKTAADPQPVDRQSYRGKIDIQTAVLERQWITISITDNGIGIPLPIQNQVFNPFFTTKVVGQGLGMGLAISHQVITGKHQGKLTFRSQGGQGTTFTIQIPIRQADPAESKVEDSVRSLS
ncbi:MAG: PAS domain-containing sensor histidine kinase [Oscillatoriales cyanobacterium]|nr:MAG: PAS domain-containing sensor histidine kinase [Oscillatoriales cyanobacterium]